MAAKSYTITFNKDKNTFVLTAEKGKPIKVNAKHKKFEWLKSQDKGKIVKINASGRWNSSKDYDGLYNKLQSNALTDKSPVDKSKKKVTIDEEENIKKVEKDLEPAKTETKSTKSKSQFGFYEMDLDVRAKMSSYSKTLHTATTDHDELLPEVGKFCATVSIVSASTIQREFKIGYNRAARIIDALEELSIIKDNKSLVKSVQEIAHRFPNNYEISVDLDIDRKSDKWPIIEKIPCGGCGGNGYTSSVSIESTGFLNLKKKEVEHKQDCTSCNTVGFSERKHYPYHLEIDEICWYNIEAKLNFDLVAKELLNELITKDEFSKQEMLEILQENYSIKSELEKQFCNQLSFEYGDPTAVDDIPLRATWSTVKQQEKKLNKYSRFYLKDAEPLIAPLFKAQLIDNGTKRRSTKDNCTYYKFTKQAKKMYQDL